MSTGENLQAEAASQAAAAQIEEGSLLDQDIGATKQTERDRAQELISTLVEEACRGTVSFNKNLSKSFKKTAGC